MPAFTDLGRDLTTLVRVFSLILSVRPKLLRAHVVYWGLMSFNASVSTCLSSKNE